MVRNQTKCNGKTQLKLQQISKHRKKSRKARARVALLINNSNNPLLNLRTFFSSGLVSLVPAQLWDAEAARRVQLVGMILVPLLAICLSSDKA
jgi:hypothetical protein